MHSFKTSRAIGSLLLGSLLVTGANAAVTSYELTGSFNNPGTLDASFAGTVEQPFIFPASFVLNFDVDDSVAGVANIFIRPAPLQAQS
ncbi:MAG: hypothetical protein R3F24_12280 [Gammaproteobacteria bacterium]